MLRSPRSTPPILFRCSFANSATAPVKAHALSAVRGREYQTGSGDLRFAPEVIVAREYYESTHYECDINQSWGK